VRRFEHPSGKFWSIEELGRTLTVRWGAIGTAGQRRDINFAQGDDPRGKLRELVAKQLALGYIEVMNTAEIVATIREDVRWYRLFEGQDGRSVALAVDGRRCYEWRDGSRDYTEHRGADFAEAKASAAAIIAVAITQGMVLGDKSEPRVEHDPTLKLRIVANPELEAQCRAAPDDPAPWAVYADWLMTQSDPRGEIAALRAQGKEPEANALFLASAAHLFGEADESEDSAFHEAITITSWRHGFARGATIKIDADSAVELDEATRRFLALPFAGFIDELQFGLAGMESNNNWGPTIRAVTDAPLALVVATACTPRRRSGWWVTSRSAPAARASSITARVGSTAKCTSETGWSGSPVTSPTRSQDDAVCGGYNRSRAATTSRSGRGLTLTSVGTMACKYSAWFWGTAGTRQCPRTGLSSVARSQLPNRDTATAMISTSPMTAVAMEKFLALRDAA